MYYYVVVCIIGLISSSTCLSIICPANVDRLNEACMTPDSHAGTCQLLADCPSLHEVSQTQRESIVTEFLHASRCNNTHSSTKYCCTDPILSGRNDVVSALLPEPGDCGSSAENKIVGGEVAGLDEFPWMARMEYTNRVSAYRCTHCTCLYTIYAHLFSGQNAYVRMRWLANQ